MGLAHMLRFDKTALICDLAETYRIYDYRALPARTVAMLACGLKPDSRIKTKMAGVETSPPFVLLYALIVDELRAIRYGLFGQKDKPVFITDIMANGLPEKKTKGFKTGAEYEAHRKMILERIRNKWQSEPHT